MLLKTWKWKIEKKYFHILFLSWKLRNTKILWKDFFFRSLSPSLSLSVIHIVEGKNMVDCLFYWFLFILFTILTPKVYILLAIIGACSHFWNMECHLPLTNIYIMHFQLSLFIIPNFHYQFEYMYVYIQSLLSPLSFLPFSNK